MPLWRYTGNPENFDDTIAAIRAAVRADRDALALRDAETRGNALLSARLAGRPKEGAMRTECALALRADFEI